MQRLRSDGLLIKKPSAIHVADRETIMLNCGLKTDFILGLYFCAMKNRLRALTGTLSVFVAFSFSQAFAETEVNKAITGDGLKEIKISEEEILPLPPGNWKLAWKGDFNPCNPSRKDCTSDGRVLILQNTNKDDFIGALVIRHSLTTSSYWPLLNCYSIVERNYGWNTSHGNRRLRDNHGTKPNQLVNKCSQASDVPIPLEAYKDSWWWGQTTEGLTLLTNLQELGSGVEIILQGLKRRRFDIDVLFNQSDLSEEQYDNLVFAWKATYVEALSNSCLLYTSPSPRDS